MRNVWLALLLVAGPHVARADDATLHSFPVPAIAIRAGQVVADEMVVERQLLANAAAVRTHFTVRERVVGKIALRALPAGAAIALNAVREPSVFKEGDRISIEFVAPGLIIRGTGVALQSGSAGQSVRVRNLETGVVLNGVVRPDHSVEVGGGG